MKAFAVAVFLILILGQQVSATRRCRYVAGLDLDPGAQNDLSQTNGISWSEDCCKMCLSNPACQGFSHHNNKCWQKKRGNGPLKSATSWGLTSGIIEDIPDTPTPTGCQAFPVNQNLDPGHDLNKISNIASYDDCCAQCKANYPDCKGFVYNNLRDCWLKYSTGPLTKDSPQWNTQAGILVVGGANPNPTPAPTPAPTTKTPLVCSSPAQQADAVAMANQIATIVDGALKIGAMSIPNLNTRSDYTTIENNVISALRNGWSAPNVCDAIANAIADPLNQIPAPAGAIVAGIVKPSVKLGCETRKTQLGC